ncbi:MAG: hypothetical protein KDK99_01390 [Verrucomicrobiales bacterium]|nr:hypothetical protein [Verrucomicrobiales bacterium]
MKRPAPDDPPPQSRPWWQGSGDWSSPWSLDDEDDTAPESPPAPPPQFEGGFSEPPPISPPPAEPSPPVATPAPMVRPVRTVVRPKATPEPRPSAALTEPVVDDETALPSPKPPGDGGISRGVIILGIVTLIGMALAWRYMHDEPAVWDEDLRLTIAPDMTGVITAPQRLEAFLESLSPTSTAELLSRDPWLWDTNSLSTMLRGNAVALDNLKDLLEDFDWHGAHAAWNRRDLGNHPAWIYAAVLKQVEAAYLDRRGEEEAAFAAAIDLLELSRRLQDILAWPSFHQRGVELHYRSLRTLCELLRDTTLSAQKLEQIQREFDACEPTDAHFKQVLIPAFYLHEKKLLLGPQSGEPLDTMPNGVRQPRPPRLFFKTNETLGMIAKTLREVQDQTGRTSLALDPWKDTWAIAPNRGDILFYGPNGAGEAYAKQRLLPYLDMPRQHQLALTQHLLVQQQLALRRFFAEHHGLPNKLEDLRPAYLKDLPLDPFSGQLFHYDLSAGLVYSVGADYLSSGGDVQLPPLTNHNEPTVPIGVRSRSARP